MLLWRRKRGQHTVFPWSVLVTPRISLCPSYSVVRLGTDPWMLRDFHWCWWRLLWYISPHVGPPPYPAITHLWVPQLVPALVYLFCCSHLLWFPYWFLQENSSFPFIHREIRGQRQPRVLLEAAAPQGRFNKARHLLEPWMDTRRFDLPPFISSGLSRWVVHSGIWA